MLKQKIISSTFDQSRGYFYCKHSLQWKITHAPLPVSFELGDMYIDLGAEKILAAEREGEKIAVEIKSFFRGCFKSPLGGSETF